MVIVGLIGATLLYGDGTITPAISVLSAIEGIKLYAPHLGRFVVPLTVIILVILFLVQHKGTSWIGRLFGPVMLVWFIVIAILGVAGIAKAPAILAALTPLPAVTYLWRAGACWTGCRSQSYRPNPVRKSRNLIQTSDNP